MKIEEKKHCRKKGYLVLKRRAGEGFKIDDETEVVITKITESAVYVAIKAPGKKVLRNEIIKKEIAKSS